MGEGIFAQLVTKEMGLLSAGAIVVMLILGSIPISKTQILRDTWYWKKLGIFLLTLICIGGSFLPGINDIPKEQWGSIIVFGCLATFGAHVGRKILQPIFLNKLEGKKKD